MVFNSITNSSNHIWLCDNCVDTGVHLTTICSKLSEMENTLKSYIERTANQESVINELKTTISKMVNPTPASASKRKYNELVHAWGRKWTPELQ